MPIFFVVCGVMVLCYLFNLFNVDDNIYRWNICIFLAIICGSYFCENISLCDVHFNLIQMLILFTIFLFAIYNSTHKFRIFLLSIVYVIAYYFVSNFLIPNSDNVNYIIYFISILASLTFNNFYEGMLCNVLCGISMEIINVCNDMNLYTFAVFDTDIIFTSILIFVLTFVIKDYFFYKSNLFGRGFYYGFKKTSI